MYLSALGSPWTLEAQGSPWENCEVINLLWSETLHYPFPSSWVYPVRLVPAVKTHA